MNIKQLSKIFFTFLALGFMYNVSAQKASAYIGATIVNPATIQNSTQAGPVQIAFSAKSSLQGGMTATRIATKIAQRTGTVTAAAFILSGSETANYSVTVANEVSLIHQNHIDTLTASKIESFTNTMKEGAGLMQTLTIDATIIVRNNTRPGMYTSAPYEVTVNYH